MPTVALVNPNCRAICWFIFPAALSKTIRTRVTSPAGSEWELAMLSSCARCSGLNPNAAFGRPIAIGTSMCIRDAYFPCNTNATYLWDNTLAGLGTNTKCSSMPEMIGADIELVSELGARGHVQADPGALEQVVLNLAINARDAMPSGGRVTIVTRTLKECICHSTEQVPSPKACVEITFTDTGSGMNAETCAHVFQPFFTTKGSQGNGLGLSTLQSIVTQQGGAVHLESVLGKGTRVFVHLPRVSK
ncbi:MAG: hypothetical protein NVS1B11_12170 [Terriglobales bacterium]